MIKASLFGLNLNGDFFRALAGPKVLQRWVNGVFRGSCFFAREDDMHTTTTIRIESSLANLQYNSMESTSGSHVLKCRSWTIGPPEE